MKKKDPVVEKYTGVRVVENFKHIDELFKNGKLFVDDSLTEDHNWYPNLCLVLKSSGKQSALARVSPDGKSVLLIKKSRDFFDIRPRNKEQQLLFDLLDDERIKVLSVTGKAGTGKSLLIGAYLAEELLNKRIKKLVITKPMEIIGGGSKFYGTVPGDEKEKLSPFLLNFKFLFNKLAGPQGKGYFDTLIANGSLEFVPLELIRGVSFPEGTAVYLDEAQNASSFIVHTLGTRMEDGCKLIMTGDINQIDVRTKEYTCGLSEVINSEMYRMSPITAYIHLIKIERGPIAELFANIFGDE